MARLAIEKVIFKYVKTPEKQQNLLKLVTAVLRVRLNLRDFKKLALTVTNAPKIDDYSKADQIKFSFYAGQVYLYHHKVNF
jgi:hypothetical protein